jgi:hypothetical protein
MDAEFESERREKGRLMIYANAFAVIPGKGFTRHDATMVERRIRTETEYYDIEIHPVPVLYSDHHRGFEIELQPPEPCARGQFWARAEDVLVIDMRQPYFGLDCTLRGLWPCIASILEWTRKNVSPLTYYGHSSISGAHHVTDHLIDEHWDLWQRICLK